MFLNSIVNGKEKTLFARPNFFLPWKGSQFLPADETKRHQIVAFQYDPNNIPLKDIQYVEYHGQQHLK